MFNNNYRRNSNVRLSYQKYTICILNILKNTVDILKIFINKATNTWIFKEYFKEIRPKLPSV